VENEARSWYLSSKASIMAQLVARNHHGMNIYLTASIWLRDGRTESCYPQGYFTDLYWSLQQRSSRTLEAHPLRMLDTGLLGI